MLCGGLVRRFSCIVTPWYTVGDGQADRHPPRPNRRIRVLWRVGYCGVGNVGEKLFVAGRIPWPQLGGRNVLIASTNGHVTIMVKSPPSYLHPGVNSEPPADAFVPPIYFSAHYSGFVLPHWFLALAFAGCAYFLCAKRFYATRLRMGLGV